MKPLVLSLAACVLMASVLRAQDRADRVAKPVPAVRTMVAPGEADSVSADSVRQQTALLPKFDLPEYVITGASAIDLPKGDKPLAEDAAVPVGPHHRAGLSTLRDRMLGPDVNRPSQHGGRSVRPFQGRATASLGTFFTPTLGIWLGQQSEGFQMDGDAGYYRTKGWSANTERSAASLGARISGMLSGDSPFLQDTRLSGAVGYTTDRYQFYGSSIPTTERALNGLSLAVSMQNLSNSEVPFAISLRNHSREILDSTWSTKQNEFGFGFLSRFDAWGLPWETAFRYESASISGIRGGTLSRFDVSVGTIFPVDAAMVRASLTAGAVRGLGGQDLTRFYPNVRMTLPLGRRHVLLAGFAPSLQYRTLADAISGAPFLTAQTLVRHTDVRQRWELGLQSDWTSSIETLVSAAYESMADRPYPVDTGHIGVWDLAYSGKATVITLRAEAVAKLTANDYFVTGLLMRSADHSDIGRSVPYDPEVEFGLVYRRRLGGAVNISPAGQFVSRRTASPSGSPRLPALLHVDLRAEYAGWKNVRFVLDATNITDRRNEMWQGYADRPFTIAAGVDVRW